MEEQTPLQILQALPGITAQINLQLETISEAIERLSEDLGKRTARNAEDVAANRSDIADLTRLMTKIELEVQALTIWQRNHDTFRCPFVGASYNNTIKLALETLLVRHFNITELHTLAHNLGINEDEIAGKTIRERAIYLIEMLERRNKLEHLIAQCMRLRPGVQWPDAR